MEAGTIRGGGLEMNRIVFMLEEKSMQELLESLLPRLIPDMDFICIPHEGKQDLEKSIPRKLRAWNKPDKFIIIRDNDCGSCSKTKEKLLKLCKDANKPETMVRIVCQELEAWYLGDPSALARAYNNDKLNKLSDKSPYRDPDSILQPSQKIRELIPEFQKISGARRMAPLLNIDKNTSRSFRITIEGIIRVFESMSETR
jgi:hypothetical protein